MDCDSERRHLMPREPLPPNPLLGLFGLTQNEARMTESELAEWEAWPDREAVPPVRPGLVAPGDGQVP
jgi:hypothetical protein